jgi:phthalate 4,5-dioxygenase reductase subunit
VQRCRICRAPHTKEAAMSVAGNAEVVFNTLVVTDKSEIASGIFRIELRDPQGRELRPFTPGAHVTMQVPSGANRNYSLSNSAEERDRYVIAVKRDADGRGGSVSLTDTVQVGDSIEVAAPRNDFPLNERARRFVFVAGGIGITPILSMMRQLKAAGIDQFKLYYCTRSPETTAFLDELSDPEWAPHVVIHHDYGNRAQAYDFWSLFEKPTSAHVYCCGPRALMDSVRDMTGHWPTGTVHFESFGIDVQLLKENKPFKVRLQHSGQVFEIPADRSILEILRDKGIRTSSSCESGTCGSCRTHLVSGEAEHRDMVLGEDERSHQIMICVSRARSDELVIDL